MTIQSSHNEFNSSEHQLDIVLICDHVNLPANIGGVLRLADAYGVSETIFLSEETKISPKAKSVSRGTNKFVNYKFVEQLDASFFEEDREWICLEITSNSKPITSFKPGSNQKVGVIIGNENRGIQERFLQEIEAFHIKMYGKNSSMNVTNSLSALLFYLTQGL